jgi:hypothetical protein
MIQIKFLIDKKILRRIEIAKYYELICLKILSWSDFINSVFHLNHAREIKFWLESNQMNHDFLCFSISYLLGNYKI